MPSLANSRSEHLTGAVRTQKKSRPEQGPRILFFSGGTALNDIASALAEATHNSAHLITPFDSGGSSQVLRRAFDMPAVGDLRSRMVALAAGNDTAQRAVKALVAHRLPVDASCDGLAAKFRMLCDGTHPLMRDIDAEVREQILTMLATFEGNMPVDFDFRRASVGNLILAGGYVADGKALDPVLDWMANTLRVRGTVRSIADVNLQIGVELNDGSRIIGQARFTGKETDPISQPIRRLFLADARGEVSSGQVPLPARNADLIGTADLICFSPGSLYSSVLANLLPQGVGTAVAARKVPKIYVPSLGRDPECFGMTLSDQIGALLAELRRDAGADVPACELVSHVLSSKAYLGKEAAEAISSEFRIECAALDIADTRRPDRYDPQRLSRALDSLAQEGA